VTCITSTRDAGQQGFVDLARQGERCFSQQRSEVDRIKSLDSLNTLKASHFGRSYIRNFGCGRVSCCDLHRQSLQYFSSLFAARRIRIALSLSNHWRCSRNTAHTETPFGFGLAIAFSKSESDPEEMGTPGEVGYDSHHGSADIRNLSTH
jgi:hypothetical protein